MKHIIPILLLAATVASGQTDNSLTGEFMRVYWKASDLHVSMMRLQSRLDEVRTVVVTNIVTNPCQRTHCDTVGGSGNTIRGGYSSEMNGHESVELDPSYPIIGGGYFSNINDPDHYECFLKGGSTARCKYGPGTCLDNHGCTHDRAYIYGGHPGCAGADCRWCVYWHVSGCKGTMEHNNNEGNAYPRRSKETR